MQRLARTRLWCRALALVALGLVGLGAGRWLGSRQVALAATPTREPRVLARGAASPARPTPAPKPPPAAAAPAPTWSAASGEHGVAVYVASPRAAQAHHADGAADVAAASGSGQEGAPAAWPVITMLHGMCSDPLATCELARGAATGHGWLVCPTGNGRCGQAADWEGSGEQKATFLEQSLAALDRLHGSAVAHDRGDVLMGFSRGAFVARDVAYARPGRWVGLVLLGAAMVPDAERLAASGIRRVVLGSGDFDGARRTMVHATAVLTRHGLQARFVSLGPIYHALPRDLAEVLAEPLAWVREPPTG